METEKRNKSKCELVTNESNVKDHTTNGSLANADSNKQLNNKLCLIRNA